MSSIILEGYGKRNLIVTQGYVGAKALPPDPPPPPPPTYFSVAVASTDGGATDPVEDNYNVLTTETLEVEATASEGYSFLRWMLDGEVETDNPITVGGVEDQQRTLLAVFIEDAPDPPIVPDSFTVTVVEASDGHASLPVGDHVYVDGDTVAVTAIPDSGNMFSNWVVDGETVLGSTLNLTVTADTTVQPAFTALPVTGDSALTLANLWSNLLSKIQAEGVNTAVTIHALELGADDGVTGQPSKYWSDVAADMVINPVGAELSHFDTGSHSKLEAKGYTDAAITDGDEVTDGFGNTWAVVGVLPFKVGGYYECTLNLKLEDTFTHPPSPSEITRTLEVTVLDIEASYDMVDVEFLVLTLFPVGAFFPYTFTFELA